MRAWVLFAAAAVVTTVTAGCTMQNWYEGARQGAQNSCQGLPPGAYEDCMSRTTLPPYEDYRKEREQAREPSR